MNLSMMLTHGGLLSITASLLIALSLKANPRMWLQDYPEEIQVQVPPRTESEKRQGLIVGIPFLLLLFGVPLLSTFIFESQSGGEVAFLSLAVHAFGVSMIFNLVDLLVLDWLMFCIITPDFIIIPGTEGAAGYQNYGYHFRAFLTGTILSIVAGLLFGGLVFLL